MKPEISVVIVNYNTRDFLRACLQSLVEQPLAIEIIVVENASQDGSAAMVRESFPDVRLLAQTRNTWYCGGNNIGIDAATADWVLLLNPDTVVAPDALTLLLETARERPDYAGATGRLIYPNGETQRTGSRIPRLAYLLANHTLPGLLLRRWKRRLNDEHWYAGWERDRDHDVSVAPGSCLLMRRSELRLDDDLLLYFPEDDLAQRVQRPFRFVAAARIEHHEKSATQSWLATRVYFRDLIVYVRKHHGLIAATLMWLLSRPLLVAMWLRRRWKFNAVQIPG